VDPDPVPDPNPDPVPDPNPDFGFWWPKMIKFYSWKIFFVSEFAIFIFICLYEGRSSYRRNLKHLKENTQNMKTWNLFTFIFLWVFFALLDPDPADQSQCGSMQIQTQIWILYIVVTILATIFWSKNLFRVVVTHWRYLPTLNFSSENLLTAYDLIKLNIIIMSVVVYSTVFC
jgi:hypothetical protein